jgi:hypothetical protein
MTLYPPYLESREFAAVKQCCFKVCGPDASWGTGFFITTDGYALTAFHNVSKLVTSTIGCEWGSRVEKLTVVNTSPAHDVALLKAAAGRYPALRLSTDFKIRDEALVVGYQSQELMPGLNPLDLKVRGNRALATVRFGDDEMTGCLVLTPDSVNDVIRGGTSGGPVFSHRTQSVVGVVLGSAESGFREIVYLADPKGGPTQPAVETEREVFGFAMPFLEPFRDWPEFQKVLARLNVGDWPPPEVQPPPPVEPAAANGLPALLPLTEGVEMAVHLVTNDLFGRFLAEHPEWAPKGSAARRPRVDRFYLTGWPPPADAGLLPVVYVSQFAAEAFLEWLGGKLGKRLRLPTPAEWRLAAGADTQPELPLGEIDYAETAMSLQPVGNFGVNFKGFCDLYGNALDLCRSEDPAGTPEGLGGSYLSTKRQLATVARVRPDECREDMGFRFVAEAQEKPK